MSPSIPKNKYIALSNSSDLASTSPTTSGNTLFSSNGPSQKYSPQVHDNEEEFELETINNLDYEIPLEEGDEEERHQRGSSNFGIETFSQSTPSSSSSSSSGSSNMKMAFMNMTNSILGAGIIGQPLAFRNSGFLGGILVMIGLTVLIDWTLVLIVKNSILAQLKSYQDTVNHCFGLTGKIVLLVSISSFAYGGCMAFCVIIGDTIPHVLKAFIPSSITEGVFAWLFSRNVIIVLFTGCISYPLSLNRDISKLAKASGFALLGMLTIVFLTVVRAPFISSDLKSKVTGSQWLLNSNIFQGISVISFALVCHHNTMFIYQSMQNATLKKFTKLTHISCFISMIFCMIMGINGYLNFGLMTKGNILNNFKSNDNWINIARFCFGLNMLTTFPLEIFVVRDVLKEILLSRKAIDGSTSHLELTKWQHFTITSLLVFTSMAVSLFTCNLGMILELIGATSASLMAYIIPPLCYLRLSWLQLDWALAQPWEKKRFVIRKALPSVGCIVFGFAVMFISSGMTIRDAIRNKNGSDNCVID